MNYKVEIPKINLVLQNVIAPRVKMTLISFPSTQYWKGLFLDWSYAEAGKLRTLSTFGLEPDL